jgi:hypothetical protein
MVTWHRFTPNQPEKAEEINYLELISNMAQAANTIEILTIKCDNCGAQTTLEGNVVTKNCDFCYSPLITDQSRTSEIIEPVSILTFKITAIEGEAIFKSWVQKRWFAPRKLDKYANIEENLRGIYLPYWSYDSNTMTHYKGQRGHDYQTQEYHTNDKGENTSNTVTKTNWSYSSGAVTNVFENVLVVATDSLPTKSLRQLEPWDLRALIPFELKYLEDFQAEIYSVSVQQGFNNAQEIMQAEINRRIRKDIGGDNQRINSQDIDYSDIKFKSILLPIWLMTYRYHHKVYRFMINGRTGKVYGERPYSWTKITLTILLLVVIIFTW